MALRFERDADKAKKNFGKHHISFDEASTIFSDSLSVTIPDPVHSEGEERFVTIGHSYQEKTIVVVHTEKGDNVRILSARLATRHERKNYEEGQKK